MSKYFSETHGLRKGTDLATLRIMTRDLFLDLQGNGDLKEWLGYYCVDEGNVQGAVANPGRDIVLDIGRSDVWPVEPVENEWSDDAIFDFLQFIGEHVSSPVAETGYFHSYNNCGWHNQDFRPEPARGNYVQRVNKILSRYGDGWEMKPSFEIVERAPLGMGELLKIKLPEGADPDLRSRVHAAVDKYRRRSSTGTDRKDAVRDLGDTLEPIRKLAAKHMSSDEADLFNILNNFGIRHNNEKQKTDYDPVWLTGLFYHYLIMIHVLTHLMERARERPLQIT